MIKKILLCFVLLLSINTFAQDEKWSAEINYPLVPQEGGFNKNLKTFDVALKYRIVNLSALRLGLDLTGGFDFDRINGSSVDLNRSTYYFQPKIFGELIMPFAPKLRTSLGIGYSVVKYNYNGEPGNIDIFSQNGADGGFNFDAGISYDISKRFFIQARYDFINLKIKEQGSLNGENFEIDYTSRINRIKVGIGFRF